MRGGVGRAWQEQAASDGGSEEALRAQRRARVVEAPRFLRVEELPREVVERLLPLLPARTLLRARVVCRCGPVGLARVEG